MAKRKAAGAKKKGKKTARKAAPKAAPRKTSRKAAARKGTALRGSARKATARKGPARKATARKAAPRKAAPGKAARKASPRPQAAPARRAPSLDRERRTIQGDDIVPTPPSSLNLDRHATAARSGRRQMQHRLSERNDTSALTAGDVDADWESAATVGDEAPGGDNPTPDQDIVDDIGRAVGVEYADNEELKGEEKIIKRDKHRWELDPASSEDYDDR